METTADGPAALVPPSEAGTPSAAASDAEKQTKKRGYVIQEIISTELTYIERLKLAIDHVILPLRAMKILEPADCSKQFDLLEKIYELHTRSTVDGSTSQNLKFIDLFNDMSKNFDYYTGYLVNYEPAMQRRGHLLTSNRRFADFIARVEKDPEINKSLESLLILPVQRIPRYRLLLEQLLKYTPEGHADYATVQASLDQICALAAYNNEAIRERENQNKIMAVMMQIDPAYRIDLLDDRNRSLLLDGLLLKQCRRRYKEFHFWLFSDQLLYGEKTPLGSYALNRQLPLNKCKVTAPAACLHGHGPADPEAGLVFVLESPAKSFKVKTRSEEERREWMAAITEAIDRQRTSASHGDTLVAPLWKPDANSNQCELCRTAFTLLFRRHHCRNCGALVCVNCSTHRFLLAHLHSTQPVRVCDGCYGKLTREGLSVEVAAVKEDEEGEGEEGDSEDDLLDRDRDSVNEGELDDFNDFMKIVEAKDSPISVPVPVPAPSTPSAEPRRVLGIPLPGFSRSAPSSSSAEPSPTTPSLWPFRRTSITSAQPPPPSPSHPEEPSSSASGNTSSAVPLAETSVPNPAQRSKVPPPKPPRRASSNLADPSAPLSPAPEAPAAAGSPAFPAKRYPRRTNVFIQMSAPVPEPPPQDGSDGGGTPLADGDRLLLQGLPS